MTFKDIKGYEGRYKVSDNGDVWSSYSEKIMKPYTHKTGYLCIRLQKGKHKKTFYIHRLVGLTFLENPENKSDINHKDSNRLNNNVSNLEWVTRKENNAHCIKNGRRAVKMKRILSFEDREKMAALYKTGKYMQKDLSETFGISPTAVRYHLKKQGAL